MSSQETVDVIRRNLQSVHSNIAAACAVSGRSPDDVTLVAVTKYAQWPWVEALATQYQVFGENRPQQLSERAPKLPSVEWHLIGQLQRNKVRQALEHAHTIHSVDSLRLLERISKVAADLNQHPNVLLQVNVSGEESKSGFRPDELLAEWDQISVCCENVRIAGLMTMAPASDDPEAARPTFRGLRQLREQLRNTSGGAQIRGELNHLSMGMSGDFSVAVQEGATLVRIGSRLFDGLVDSESR
ncbi:YggS family pyridoxal phosphate-dependent enzyme [Fuerstiella marisgermanici]|uniref:Pyridoxal phosphate homeostasis protein n=1 Tax=Fuerstiella marisgermanici TaxID=1891926 RepID=A0A1P8WJF0_9PLAN|nr:YggS family pyridoxal phosphate-dependent enzyme [Fuerstiella marisgermanici]APZ94182.1 pyridoxal phosphate enzyme, YggS family [Fuerstiella marisgermanici]